MAKQLLWRETHGRGGGREIETYLVQSFYWLERRGSLKYIEEYSTHLDFIGEGQK